MIDEKSAGGEANGDVGVEIGSILVLVFEVVPGSVRTKQSLQECRKRGNRIMRTHESTEGQNFDH